MLDARARQRALHGADRVPRDRQARRRCRRCRTCAALVAAGEALNPEVLRVLAGGHRARDPRRLRPDRDRPADRQPAGRARPARLDGPAAARGASSRSRTASSCSPIPPPTRRSSSATSAATRRRPGTPWHTGDRVQPRRGRLPVLRGPRRRRDHLRRLPDRPVRGRVRARRPPGRGRGRRRGGARRGARRGRAGRGRAARRRSSPAASSSRELQDHVKRETAPYKYPRIVEFAAELPKTASGKIKRAELRGD